MFKSEAIGQNVDFRATGIHIVVIVSLDVRISFCGLHEEK